MARVPEGSDNDPGGERERFAMIPSSVINSGLDLYCRALYDLVVFRHAGQNGKPLKGYGAAARALGLKRRETVAEHAKHLAAAGLVELRGKGLEAVEIRLIHNPALLPPLVNPKAALPALPTYDRRSGRYPGEDDDEAKDPLYGETGEGGPEESPAPIRSNRIGDPAPETLDPLSGQTGKPIAVKPDSNRGQTGEGVPDPSGLYLGGESGGGPEEGAEELEPFDLDVVEDEARQAEEEAADELAVVLPLPVRERKGDGVRTCRDCGEPFKTVAAVYGRCRRCFEAWMAGPDPQCVRCGGYEARRPGRLAGVGEGEFCDCPF